MSNNDFPLIFDGHNDTVSNMIGSPDSFFKVNDDRHLDLPRAKTGGLGGGIFAVYIGDPAFEKRMQEIRDSGRDPMEVMREEFSKLEQSEHVEFPDPMDLDYAQSRALVMLGTLFKVEALSEGQVTIVRTAAELQHALDSDTFAIELHFEGAEPLDADGDALEVFYATGLRSVGLTHSRRNIFCEGVPMGFGNSPDTGPGLTEAGERLVRQLNRKKIMIDLSHINEQGFWDVAKLSDAPLVASHSNAWELSRSPRNLTDKQMDAIKESHGIAGLNYLVSFLRSDGGRETDVPVSLMVDHIEYMVDRMGIDCVGLGSDFDGAFIPDQVGDAAGLPVLMQALVDRGYSGVDLEKLAHGNWVRVLGETWGE